MNVTAKLFLSTTFGSNVPNPYSIYSQATP